MVDNKHFRSDEPDADNYDDDFAQPRIRQYAFGRSANRDYDSVPLFLSDPDGEPDPEEFANPLRPRRASISLRILMGVVAASGVAVLFAWFTSDATRDVLVSAKASLSTILPIPSTAAQAEASPPPQAASTQLTTRDAQLKDPARWQAAGAQLPGAQTPPTVRGPQVAMAPSREDISNAYQSAVQNRTAPAAAPPAVAVAPPVAAPPVAVPPPVAAPPARQLDPEEIALLMKRAKDLLASGDIPPARLLLRRAADAQEPTAALLLAQTYDPDVLGTQDVRNINPDIAMARTWYQRAAELGSADAQRRLAQLQN
jgi:hypothetical protein